MTSLAITALLPQRAYQKQGIFCEEPEKSEFTEYICNDVSNKAIVIEDNSILLDPKYMNLGQYYLAIIHEMPYLYRKVNNEEIEIYGLAEEN